MSRIEEQMLRRVTGGRIFFWSFIFGIACYLPLQLYILFGPADGNPIGLGLLAVFGVPVALMGMLMGVIKLLVEYFLRRSR